MGVGYYGVTFWVIFTVASEWTPYWSRNGFLEIYSRKFIPGNWFPGNSCFPGIWFPENMPVNIVLPCHQKNLRVLGQVPRFAFCFCRSLATVNIWNIGFILSHDFWGCQAHETSSIIHKKPKTFTTSKDIKIRQPGPELRGGVKMFGDPTSEQKSVEQWKLNNFFCPNSSFNKF